MPNDTDKGSAKSHTITVNGRERVVNAEELTFKEVVLLAFPDAIFDEKTAYTITYSRGEDKKPKGSLVEGESVKIKNGQVFNVTATDRS